MKNSGFIFTLDAALSLIPLFIILASVSTISITSTPTGFRVLANERLAQDVISILDRNETLRDASIKYQTGVKRGDDALKNEVISLLNGSLNSTLPDYIGYELTVSTPAGSFNVTHGNPSLASDIIAVSSTTVGPPEGWAGIAWYKIERANFTDIDRTSVSTAWNFHNWLSNFEPWANGWDTATTSGLDPSLTGYPYWGSDTSRNPVPITFSISPNATINSASFVMGSAERQAGWQNWPTAGTDPIDIDAYFNGQPYSLADGDYSSVQTTTINADPWMFEYHFWNAIMQIAPADLLSGSNSFYVNYLDAEDTQGWVNGIYTYQVDDMPWFSILVNQTIPVPTPQNLVIQTTNLPDSAGAWTAADPTITWADGDAAWANAITNGGSPVDDGTPFRILPAESFMAGQEGSAISVVGSFTIPSGVTVHDATVDLNPYGSVDNTRVEIRNSSGQWQTIFNSFDIGGIDYTDVGGGAPGFGNLPGRLDIPASSVTTGSTNYVRVTLWDYAPGGGDWDWVGLIDSSVTVSYTSALMKWSNFPLQSHQNDIASQNQTRTFFVDNSGKEVLLFIGVGLDSRSLMVELQNTTSPWRTLYNSSSSIPFMLNLGELDAGLPAAEHILTSSTSTPSDYTIIPANYTLRVSITSSSEGYESGDSSAEIFSGTKVTVLYPEFLNLTSVNTFNETAAQAMQSARLVLSGILNDTLQPNNVSPDDPDIFAEATFVGGEPFTTYLTLKVWNR